MGRCREKTLARGEKSPGAAENKSCSGKAEVINMLVWAHQCHLLGGNRLPGEFVNIRVCEYQSLCTSVCVHQPPSSAFGEEHNRQWGAVSRPRVCSRLQPQGCGELSPVILAFGRSGSAWLVEIKSDSEAARGKSMGPGEAGQDGFALPGEGELSGTLNPHRDGAAPAKPNPQLRAVLCPTTGNMKL